mmetsp:Transcript_6629/g.16305  ORF Transcript_6629/g.16305 Transcript_6629/m.16305 type:complete len:204 (-) Transcript_6629:263-874(-)
MVHVRQKGRGGNQAVGFSNGDHRFREQPSVLDAFLKGSITVLDVEHQGIGSLGDLFAHDAGRLQGKARNGGSHVPQRVDPSVRGAQIRSGLHDGAADPAPRYSVSGIVPAASQHRAPKILDALRRRRVTRKARFELVDRPPGVTEAPAGHHRNADPAGGDQRSQHQRDLVTDAAARVLVHQRGAAGGSCSATRRNLRPFQEPP